ncbi:hypothetical protein NL676_021258 [Syzygium grande]|nr:hypothetical protein NL676_021258 [Syzygium grande]
MGQCYGKATPASDDDVVTISVSGDHNPSSHPPPPPPPPPPASSTTSQVHHGGSTTPARPSNPSPWASPYPHGVGVSPSPGRATPRRKFFRRPFPPPSPAKHIKVSLAKRFAGYMSPKHHRSIPEEGREGDVGGPEGRPQDQLLAVKIISKVKMTTAISIEDVRREVKILKALSGHKHLVKFYDAYLCEGGELLDRILSRGGRYAEEDAKVIVVQILSVVAFCHLQGVVHRDLKPENFLFTSRSEDADMKLIDFGLSDFIRPDERLNDIVGSAYYVAPEVLHRSYSLEADIWSIGGLLAFHLLRANPRGTKILILRTESGIFRAVLRADPNFEDLLSVSREAKDFVKRLLNKDYRKRMTAVQALTHPWLRDESRPSPLDILIFKLVKLYLHAMPLKRAALKALLKALTEEELVYLRAQFQLLEPNKDGFVSLDNFRGLFTPKWTAFANPMLPESRRF